jgi:hypothetical protein
MYILIKMFVQLVFISSAKYHVLLTEGDIPQQIKDFLLNKTKERGKMVFLHNCVEITSETKLSQFENGGSIDCMVLQKDPTLRKHIIESGYNPNAFTYCGPIAMASENKYTPISVY